MFSSARRTTGSCNFLVERLHSQRPRNSHFGPLDPDPAAIELRSADFSPPASGLVPRSINTTTFAARDFWPRRGSSDEHTLQRSVRSEQRRLGQKEPPPGGLRRFSVLASLLLGHSPTAGMLPRRASPEPKIDATNVVVFLERGTKGRLRVGCGPTFWEGAGTVAFL